MPHRAERRISAYRRWRPPLRANAFSPALASPIELADDPIMGLDQSICDHRSPLDHAHGKDCQAHPPAARGARQRSIARLGGEAVRRGAAERRPGRRGSIAGHEVRRGGRASGSCRRSWSRVRTASTRRSGEASSTVFPTAQGSRALAPWFSRSICAAIRCSAATRASAQNRSIVTAGARSSSSCGTRQGDRSRALVVRLRDFRGSIDPGLYLLACPSLERAVAVKMLQAWPSADSGSSRMP